MKRTFNSAQTLFVAAALLVVACAAIASARTGNTVTVWPQPRSFEQGGENIELDSSNFAIFTASKSAVLQSAIKRYLQGTLLFPFQQAKSNNAQSVNLTIVVTSDDDTLQFGVDESYSISIPTPVSPSTPLQAVLQASTPYGALRGLETFSQLIEWDDSLEVYYIPSLPITIKDQPRFPWRGLLIDTSRHYLTKKAIKRTIDAMSYSKFNTLHWHITDAQSFPVVSTTYPSLSKGAYSAKAIYTHEDISDIVQYAKERGVRVVAEFDIPGHSAAWGVGYPQLVANCPSYVHNINNVAMDISNDFTYELLAGFLGEMASLFPDNYLHLGGDEVVYGCWFNDPKIKQWAQQKGFTTGKEVYKYFEDRLQMIVNPVSGKINRTVVVWDELFEEGIPMRSEMIVQVWRSIDFLGQVIKAGYRGLLSAGFYLDKQIPDTAQTWYLWEDTWKNFYMNEPTQNLVLTPAEEARLLGGEAAMWGENVDDTCIDSRVWPRASATAERFWSAKEVNDVDAAKPRLATFRCKSLARRGIGAGPVMPDYCALP